jgi:hypothetical protein
VEDELTQAFAAFAVAGWDVVIRRLAGGRRQTAGDRPPATGNSDL